MRRLGLEPRDLTHDPAEYKQITLRIVESIRDENWIKFLEGGQGFQYETINLVIRDAFSDIGLDAARIKRLHLDLLGISMPLSPFENGRYLNYRTGEWFELNSEQKARVIQARKNYLKKVKQAHRKSLKDRLRSWRDRTRPPISKQEWERLLVEWAQEAHVSEFYFSF